MNLVDSSCWLEYLADSDRAHLFAEAIEEPERLIVPVIVLYEVFKKVLRERGEDMALQVAGLLQSGKVIGIDESLVYEAARYPLPMADSLIYATSTRYGATLWTQDQHFTGLPGVRFFQK
ncbi:MAG: hypothetical protein RLZ45_2700 [Verrucomicrobiota bacterium]|jgi:predicted nucleic acid-binding protein